MTLTPFASIIFIYLQRGFVFLKKLLITVLSLLLIFSFATINAVPSAPNYLFGLAWKKGHSSTIQKVDGLYVEATNLTKSYSTPALDIAPALKQAFYDHAMSKYISVRIQGKIKLDFEENKKESDSLRIIIRAKTNLANSDAWKADYLESLNNDDPFFMVLDTNVYAIVLKDFSVSTNWGSFTCTVPLTKNNVFCEMTPTWDLCVDGLDISKKPKTLYLKDLSLDVVSVSNNTPGITPTATPAVTPTATPTPNIPPRRTPDAPITQTLIPFRTPVSDLIITQPTATLKPTLEPEKDEEIREEFINQPAFKDAKNIFSLSIKGAIVIIIFAGFFAIILNLFRRKKE